MSCEGFGVMCLCVETLEGQLGLGCALEVNWRWVIIGAMVYSVQGLSKEIKDLTFSLDSDLLSFCFYCFIFSVLLTSIHAVPV